MSQFITDLAADPFAGRLVVAIYGATKIGKTSMLLSLIRNHPDQVLYLISADKGTKQAQLEPDVYKGRLALAYPDTLQDYRAAIAELGDRIPAVAKKRGAENVWVAVDTVTHMQMHLLAEARKITVKHDATSMKRGSNEGDLYVRDATTSLDYNVNLGHMVELVNQIMALPANTVFMVLEKEFEDQSTKRMIARPAIQGASRDKIVGDADVVARMVLEPSEGDPDRRVLCVAQGSTWHAGDRTGRLAAKEPADLHAMRRKIFSRPEQRPVLSAPPAGAAK